MTEQDAKSKVHLRLLGRSIGLPSEAREVIEIVWKAAAEFFQAQQPMPAWMQYEPVTDVLTIHGKKYAASLFGNSGFLGNAGDILRIEQGSDDVVTVTKIQPEKADKFATGGLRKNYIPPIPIWTGLGQHPMKRVPPVPSASAEDRPVGRFIKGDMNRAFELYPAGKNLLNGTELYTHPAQPVQDEIARLKAALKKANDQAEHFEREWYLRGDEIKALKAQPVQPAGAQRGFSWATGEPPKWFEEWFIAKLDNGQRVVLKRLPEDFTYDYTTADETYYAKRRIAKWMQFPDSEFVSLNPSPAAAQSWELDEETAKLLADLILANDDPTPVTLSVGFIKEDDGKIKHGLRVYESEYPEEGAILLSESTPVSQRTPAAAINEQLIGELKHIAEYWNRDQNERAMADALWHIIRVAETAIAAAEAEAANWGVS